MKLKNKANVRLAGVMKITNLINQLKVSEKS